MTTGRIDDAQHSAASVVGLSYLLALVPAIFAEFYVRARLVVPGDAAQSAANIMGHERLFRLGIAGNLAVFAIDVALITALYLVLQPVHRRLALLALGWGMIETAVLVFVTLSDFDVLRILSGASYLHVFEADRLQALARLSIGAHAATYNVGLVFAGLRSTTFCYLWLKSGYVPRGLALAGVIASFLMGACPLALVIAPELATIFPIWLYGGPIFLFELTMGFWLVFKGIRTHPSPQAP